MDSVLNSQTLWEGVDPCAEQLDATELKLENDDGVITRSVYFTGRTLSNGTKSRIYAQMCYKNDCKNKPAVLVVSNYSRAICTQALKDIASRGFVAMSIDFAGRRSQGIHTLYPDDLDYCNDDVARTIFEITDTPRETKLFEYAFNARRAITYLLEEKVSSVSVLTCGKGVYVGLIVLAVDARVKNGAILFGNLSRSYPDETPEEQADLERNIAYDNRRQVWTLGLAPQTYASQIKVPVYVVNSANSPYVDLAQASKMFLRINSDSRFVILPNTMDYLPSGYTDGVIRWLNGKQAPTRSEIKSFFDGGDYCLRVITQHPLDKTSLWYATNNGSANYWTKAELKPSDNGYVAKLNLYDKECHVSAFALFDGDIAVSTSLFSEKVTAVNVKKPTNIIFTGTGKQILIPLSTDGQWWNVNLQHTLAKGALNIVGAKGKALATFAVNDKSIHASSALTVCFDVCSPVSQQVKVTAVGKFGNANECYYQIKQVGAGGKWERLDFDKLNFHSVVDGRPIAETTNIEMLIISAESEIIINNLFLV
ncbi:MAG: hypothetical protein J1G02_01595 [Clostridiales bacterium]|nr:hypothetical protein [Clostridiales bacterium]